MSYYESSSSNGQWPTQNTWDHQVPPMRSGTNGPSSQDEFAFFYQFDEVDRAFDNLSKSGKTYGAAGRHSRGPVGMPGPRGHGPEFDPARGHPSNVQGFYASQRHVPSRGSSEAEQMMQAKRRMAAQRERELRNLHTEQQYQRTVLTDVSYTPPKGMSEEETRDLIARQRSALYKEGPFAEKGGFVDENGVIRTGVPTNSGPASLRGASPLPYDIGRGVSANPEADAGQMVAQDIGSRPNSTTSPQSNPTSSRAVFDSAIGQNANRTSTSSPGGSPSRQELPGGSKAAQGGHTVAPIGTRPSGTPVTNASSKRSSTPLASPGSWGRGGWPQASGLGGQASVWA